MKIENKIKDSTSDKVFNVINNIILAFFLIIVLYPLIYVVSASFSNPTSVISGKMWLWPVDLTIDGYKIVFNTKMVWVGYGNSLIYMVAATIVNLFMTILAAYPLSRKELYGKNIIMFIFVFTMYFGGGLIPSYLVVQKLGLINSRLALIIPGAMSVWNVIIARTFIKGNIPDDLLDAARIDGCDDFTFVSKIVIPLSKPVLAVIALFCAVGTWNSYFGALLYLNDKSKFPLQIVLRDILVMNQSMDYTALDAEKMLKKQHMSQLLKYSLIIVSSLPLLIIYPFVQKYFTKGIMIGAIKG